MSRLKHPIRSLTEPFGKAGLTVAVIALVFALIGGAYAAGGLTKAQEKQVTKIAKKYAGKPGAPGVNGANGTNGAAGKEGPEGKPGAPGNDGTSVTGTAASNAECEGNGGVKYTSTSGTNTVCNGTTGFTETLPSGKTLKGDWSLSLSPEGSNKVISTDVSFGIPLEEPPAAHYIRAETGKEPFYNPTTEVEEERTQSECPGNSEDPKANPGNLCVYGSSEFGARTLAPGTNAVLPRICSWAKSGAYQCQAAAPPNAGADRFGFGLVTFSEGTGIVSVAGSWAVTAE